MERIIQNNARHPLKNLFFVGMCHSLDNEFPDGSLQNRPNHGGTLILTSNSTKSFERNASLISLFSSLSRCGFQVRTDDRAARFSRSFLVSNFNYPISWQYNRIPPHESCIMLPLGKEILDGECVEAVGMLVFSLPEDCPYCEVASICTSVQRASPVGSN
ncbi:hypothetical protein Tco_0323832 [Tanacetum coccineum]|uniref:Uncharacterized protein n=1 Tax=Tanacetum coccineum TaxID=301880 RepID=A0ABQ5DHH9_9ASTR